MTQRILFLPALLLVGLTACGPEFPEREGQLVLEPGRAPSGYVPYG